VKVTDRGPFAPGRVVDLSWAAARALGILEQGLARVKVEPVE
jgi:peptidoglycan lytic transglycosylase